MRACDSQIYQLDPLKNTDGAAITDMIMAAAENDRATLSIIVAGYSDKVREKWLAYNEGLPSRFPITLDFEDFGEVRAGRRGVCA